MQNKPRLKVAQYPSAMSGDYTIYNVFNVDSAWCYGFSVSSNTFKKTGTIDAYISYLEGIKCDSSVAKIRRILKQSIEAAQ